jgi:hypothetical protein
MQYVSRRLAGVAVARNVAIGEGRGLFLVLEPRREGGWGVVEMVLDWMVRGGRRVWWLGFDA